MVKVDGRPACHCHQGIRFPPILSSRWTRDPREQAWVKFGYRSDKKVEIFLEEPPPGTHCLNRYAKGFWLFFCLKGPCALVVCGKKKHDLLKNKYGTLIPQPLLSEKWVFFVKFQIYLRDGNFKYFSIFILGVAWGLLESFQLVYWLKFHIDLCAILIKQVHSWGPLVEELVKPTPTLGDCTS